MIILTVGFSRSNCIYVLLDHDDMKVDPRIIGYYEGKFRFSVKKKILEITRIDGYEGWPYGFKLRLFMATETIPDFTSTDYTYHGLRDERAPRDTTKVIFHPSVTTIWEYAFFRCESLLRITIPDKVTRIEEDAFHGCHSLRFIRLSINLEFIGKQAFLDCNSLQQAFLPPTVTHIGDGAFGLCKLLRYLNVPEAIEHIGEDVVLRCDRLLMRVNYKRDLHGTTTNNETVNEWLKTHHNKCPLSIVCYSTSVTPQMIQESIQADIKQKQRLINRFKILLVGRQRMGLEAVKTGEHEMVALHILCANPHVTGDCIRTYLQLAPEAADREDSEGMTPFHYLQRNEITFLEDRSFPSLKAWWDGCML